MADTMQTGSRTVPFAERYPLETFAAIADAAWWRAGDFTGAGDGSEIEKAAHAAARAADAADKIRVDEHEKTFAGAVEDHLQGLRAIGRLVPVTGIQGRDVTLANAWNAMVAGTPDKYHHRWLIDGFTKLFVDEFVRMDMGRFERRREGRQAPGEHVAPGSEAVLAAWTGICTRMDAGTTRQYERGLSMECTDSQTGDRCEIHFSDWKPVLMVRNARHGLEPAEDVAIPELVTVEFPVPTGRLMMTDYLRVPGFNEGVTFASDREYRELDLSNARGRDARIRAHAAEHGIAYTQTTNTTVAIHRHDVTGMMLVTNSYLTDANGDDMPEDKAGNTIIPGWTCIGSFSCDMWRIMAFDRSTAIARMEAGGCDDAEKVLDGYLASKEAYARNVLTLDVEPGTWLLHSGDDLYKRVDRARYDLPDWVTTWCLMERVK